MGNVRLSYFKNAGGSAEVLEENNFYAFGLKHEGYNQTAGNPSYNYQYNGKELQKETGWSDYGARMYMADIGRWGVIDPLAETSRRFTPYNYAYDNPISFIDPDGRKAMAVDEGWSWNVPVQGSGWFNHRRNFGSFEEFVRLNESKKIKESGGGSADTFGETQLYKDIMAYLAESASPEPDFSKFDFKQFGSEGDDNTEKALSYKKQYKINKDIQMAETVLSEALLETTNYGQILQYSRKALVKIYGSEDEKSINTVYSVLVGKLDFYKKTLSRKADNPVYNTIVAGIITTLGANTLRLEIKNEYILHQIKKMDINVYRTIFPEYTTSKFGGGGAKGKW